MMMRLTVFALLAVASVAALASSELPSNELLASAASRVQHTSVLTAADWNRVSAASAERAVPLVFAVKLRNMKMLESVLLETSNPESPLYGKHLSFEEVGELTADRDAAEAVVAWLESAADISREQIAVTPNADFVQVEVPVARASELLSTEFHVFEHAQTGQRAVRAERYVIPEALAEHVDFIGGATLNPTQRPRRETRVVAESVEGGIPPGFVTPAIMTATYNIADPNSNGKSLFGLYESLGQSYSPADLSAYANYFNITAVDVVKTIGPNTPAACAQNPNNCVEASLDIDIVSAVAGGAKTWYWSIAQSDQHPFLDWVMAVASTPDAPQVYSMSYGSIEQAEDPATLNRFNDELIKLGARGITVLASSGDDGQGNFIVRNNASMCDSGFHPSFPASAPYVLAVGATMGPENSQPEVPCTSDKGGGITTGGGLSTVFKRSAWQETAFDQYTSQVSLPPRQYYAPGGRPYPDVSALGHNFVEADGGKLAAGSGTSASCPLVAAMFTLINDARLAAGKSTVGFVNQALYKMFEDNSGVFNVVNGEGFTDRCAAGQQGSQTCCEYGWAGAASGWDPLTGLGSLNFPALKKAFMAL